MKRRAVLRAALGSMASLAALPFAAGCRAAGHPDPWASGNYGQLAARLGSRLLAVLRLAGLAPSTRNMQPWTVRVAARERWVIGTEPARWLPAVDPENRQAMLGIGAFLENLLLAARSWGYDGEYVVRAAVKPTDREVLTLALKLGGAAPAGLDAIRRRCTVRGPFERHPLRPEDVDGLLAGIGGAHYFSADSPMGRRLAQGTRDANRTQVAREAAQAELARWLRWTDAELERSLTGLTPASLELGRIAAWYATTFYDRGGGSQWFLHQTVETVDEWVRDCGGWVVITSDSGETAALIEAGRRLERLFLRVRERDIAVHPMSQMLEEDPWRGQLSPALGLDRPVQMLLRVGYRRGYPDADSIRMKLSQFVSL